MIVGIDLGTSTSEIAYVNKLGKPELIPNHLGEFITPSVVYIDEDMNPIVGLEAKEKMILEPENTFMEVKRLLGNNDTLTARGKIYTPIEVSSFILKYLIDCAESFLNEKVDSAVITVPAYFTDVQRKETLSAGEMLGIKIERIINEPTAAALDYGMNHIKDCNYILVYDLGGGTLDVTVLELFEGVIDVKASFGNNSLGGKDFDQALMDYINKKIAVLHNIDISNDLRARVRIKKAAEECKIALSDKMEYKIDLPFLYNKNNQPIGFSETITREMFENLIRDKVFSTTQQIKTVLFDSGISANDIDMVLLVGGSTKIPLVTQFLRDELCFEPKNLVDPDLAVVKGAAIQSGIISGAVDEESLVLTDICPYSLSTDVLKMNSYKYDDIECDFIIRKNTPIPATVSKIYYTTLDNQTRVPISVFQGESKIPEENYMLNKCFLSGIPKAKAGKESIRVSFSYDLNGILIVTGQIVSNGKSVEITIDTTNVNSSKQVDLSEWKKSKNAKAYRSIIQKGERISKTSEYEYADDALKAVEELKKGLVLDWNPDVLEVLKDDLLNEIELYENNLGE